jgi:tetratricopeptide (TPR) repeat protein
MNSPTDLNQDLLKAHQLHMAGRLHSAQDLYGKILSIEPDNADALHLSGLIAFQLRNFEKAEELIQKAIWQKPDFPNFYQSIGTVYKHQGELDKALASCKRSYALCTQNPDILYEIGNIHYQKGAFKEAEEWMKTVILNDNTHVNALLRLSTIQSKK